MSKWDVTRERRFWEKVEKRGACWIWTGTRTSGGYGQLNIDGHRVYAHRYSYDLAHPGAKAGPFEVVMHSCDNPSCVFPDHLIAGTQKDNMADAASKGRINPWCASKVNCKRGHPLSGQNLRRNSNGSRQCKACHALRQRTRKAAITSAGATLTQLPATTE